MFKNGVIIPLFEAKFVKKRKWLWNSDKNKFEKKIKKYCIDEETGQNAKGYKVQGNKCIKMKASEIFNKHKGIKKALKTKNRKKTILQLRKERIAKMRKNRGLE